MNLAKRLHARVSSAINRAARILARWMWDRCVDLTHVCSIAVYLGAIIVILSIGLELRHLAAGFWVVSGTLLAAMMGLLLCIAIWVILTDKSENELPKEPVAEVIAFGICILAVILVTLLHYNFQSVVFRCTKTVGQSIVYGITGHTEPVFGTHCREIGTEAKQAYSYWPKVKTTYGSSAGIENGMTLWVVSVHVTSGSTIIRVAAKTWYDANSNTLEVSTGAYIVDSDGRRYDIAGECGEFNVFSRRTLVGKEIYKWDLVFPPLVAVRQRALVVRHPQFKDVEVELQWDESDSKPVNSPLMSRRPDEPEPVAQPGFYLKLSRCHACVPSHPQEDALITLNNHGVSAFYGNPHYDTSRNIDFLEKLQGVHGFPVSLLVGPFQSEPIAEQFVTKLPSILIKQIAADQLVGTTETPTGSFEIEVVKVLSAKATGTVPGLLPEELVIQPGVGIGRLLLGNRRSAIHAVLGAPRYAAGDDDSWQSGDNSLTVSYRNGTVDRIEVISPQFHTATGLTMEASVQEFLRAFPESTPLCCGPYSASGSVGWTCWDAVAAGLALQKGYMGGNSYNALIVHHVNQPVRQSTDHGDQECKPCVP